MTQEQRVFNVLKRAEASITEITGQPCYLMLDKHPVYVNILFTEALYNTSLLLDIDTRLILGDGQTKELSNARKMIVAAMREFSDISYPALATKLNKENHTTIVSAYKKHKQHLECEFDYRYKYEQLLNNLTPTLRKYGKR